MAKIKTTSAAVPPPETKERPQAVTPGASDDVGEEDLPPDQWGGLPPANDDFENTAEKLMLFDLYKARVSHAETINTMRRDAKVIFRECLAEARLALEIFKSEVEK